MAETPFLARTQGRTVGDTPHVSLRRVSFKGANPHSLWRALGQLEPVRQSRARVDTGTPRGVTRPHSRAQPERHFSATDHVSEKTAERAVSQAATRHMCCKGTVPSNGREQTRELHFLEVSPYADLRLNLDFNTELRTIVPRPRR